MPAGPRCGPKQRKTSMVTIYPFRIFQNGRLCLKSLEVEKHAKVRGKSFADRVSARRLLCRHRCDSFTKENRIERIISADWLKNTVTCR